MQASEPGPATKAPILLVVENEPLIRVTLAEFLELSGFAVVQSANAAEALSLLEADAPVDLLFSDVDMPGTMNGFGLAEWVHSHRPEVPVLLTSGLPQMLLHAQALSDECHTLMQKPYKLDAVERRIRGLLGGAMNDKA